MVILTVILIAMGAPMDTEPQTAGMGAEPWLQLMTWLSPSFPVGAYTYSHGLEYAVETGVVTDEPSLENWVRTIAELGAGRVDAALLAAAWRAAEARDAGALQEALDVARAFRGAAELALEATAQGRAFWDAMAAAHPAPDALAWVAAETDAARDGPPYPFAVGAAAALAGAPLPSVATAYLHAFAANIISAGVRLIPLGQTAGVRILASVNAEAAAWAAAAIAEPLEEVGSAAFFVELCSIKHETQHTRLFRS
ncbi:MAG: urease accessory UreF family protein [Pseudomonadota bacterium]